jgi:hypothetical protein
MLEFGLLNKIVALLGFKNQNYNVVIEIIKTLKTLFTSDIEIYMDNSVIVEEFKELGGLEHLKSFLSNPNQQFREFVEDFLQMLPCEDGEELIS